jgi:hypothetical protein
VDTGHEHVDLPLDAERAKDLWGRFAAETQEPAHADARIEAQPSGGIRVSLPLGDDDIVTRARARSALERFRVWVERGAEGPVPDANEAAAVVSGGGRGKLSGAEPRPAPEWPGPSPPESGPQTAPDNQGTLPA